MRQKKQLERGRLLEIRRLAETKLGEFGYIDGSVDAGSFASFLGAEVKYAPYEDGDLAGMLVRTGATKPVIAVNSSHHPNRRRFTIAHECGHLVLHAHKDIFVDEKLSVRMRNSESALAVSIEEIEANQFAAEILMPKRQLIRDIDEINLDIEDDADTKVLAKKYQVSLQAMTYRIYNITSELLII